MKRLLMICAIAFLIQGIKAQEYQESINYASDDYVDKKIDLPVVRMISGGTVFRISYGDGWTPEMKGAFEYACKIWEENLPPCLPITIRAEIGTIRSSSALAALSKVAFKAQKKGFNLMFPGLASPNTQIKRVTLKELETGINATFIKSFEDATFFHSSESPDIRIVYNKSKLNEFSYSLNSNQTDKYDFVTIVLRDIAKGLGFLSDIRMDRATGKSLYFDPDRAYMPFENKIWNVIGRTDLEQAYAKATSGMVELDKISAPGFQLYAPENWADGISLNSFIPNESYKITQLLDHEFGRGCIIRDLSDKKMDNLFRDMLGWEDAVLVGQSGSKSNGEGSTDVKLPYKGSISLVSSSTSSKSVVADADLRQVEAMVDYGTSIADDVLDYCKQFHAYYRPNNSNVKEVGWTMSILKKDGTWDLVHETPAAFPFYDINMAELEFHYPDSTYARTCDGYLRGRATYSTEKATKFGPYWDYKSHFIVIDYLPQTIEMGVSEMSGDATYKLNTLADDGTHEVKVGLKNIEGLTRVVVERKRQGQRVPSKFEVPDFRDGYFITTVDDDIRTTFTAIGYNENGSSRSLPLTIEPIVSDDPVAYSMSMDGENIIIESNDPKSLSGLNYEILPLNANSGVSMLRGCLTDCNAVSISVLPAGVYALVCVDRFGVKQSFKFVK